MYDPTNFSDELNRKTVEALQHCFYQYQMGQITPAQFKTGVTVLWDVVSGLVNPELQQYVDDALNAVTSIKSKRVAVWLRGTDNIVCVSLEVGRNEIKFSSLTQRAFKIQTYENASKAVEAFNKCFTKWSADSKFQLLFGDNCDSWA